jgi:protein subunit release factor B
MFPVRPEKERSLRERLERIGVHEKDLRETFVRSQGHGGQNVNKTSTCVHLKHVPSGTEVKCQKTRSQGLNRYYARVLLYEKMESALRGRQSEEARRIAKIRRQKQKRTKRAQEKVLAEKHLQSRKKAERTFNHDSEF